MVSMSRLADRLLRETLLLDWLTVSPCSLSKARGQLPIDPTEEQVADIALPSFSLFTGS